MLTGVLHISGVAPGPRPGLDWGKPKTVGFVLYGTTKDTKVSTHAGVFRSASSVFKFSYCTVLFTASCVCMEHFLFPGATDTN